MSYQDAEWAKGCLKHTTQTGRKWIQEGSTRAESSLFRKHLCWGEGWLLWVCVVDSALGQLCFGAWNAQRRSLSAVFG